MRLEDLQAAARELPQHQPSEAQKAALRASLVEVARAERPEVPRRRTAAVLVAAGAALAAAALAAVWWTTARPDGETVASSRPAAAAGARRATIQSSRGPTSSTPGRQGRAPAIRSTRWCGCARGASRWRSST